MTGEPAHRLLRALPTTRRLGRAWIAGRLFDLGDYPGAVLEPDGTTRVWGELWEFQWRRGVLRGLDRYESTRFVRRRVSVRLATRALDAWTYVLARTRTAAPIPTGDWKQRGAQRAGGASAPSRARRSATSSPSKA